MRSISVTAIFDARTRSEFGQGRHSDVKRQAVELDQIFAHHLGPATSIAPVAATLDTIVLHVPLEFVVGSVCRFENHAPQRA